MCAVAERRGIVVSESSVVRLFCPIRSWTTGRRNHSRALDDGSMDRWIDGSRPTLWQRQEGTSRRVNGAHTRSATTLGREVRINFEYPERTHDNATGIQM